MYSSLLLPVPLGLFDQHKWHSDLYYALARPALLQNLGQISWSLSVTTLCSYFKPTKKWLFLSNTTKTFGKEETNLSCTNLLNLSKISPKFFKLQIKVSGDYVWKLIRHWSPLRLKTSILKLAGNRNDFSPQLHIKHVWQVLTKKVVWSLVADHVKTKKSFIAAWWQGIDKSIFSHTQKHF